MIDKALEQTGVSMSNPVLQTFLEIRDGARDAAAAEQAAEDQMLEQALAAASSAPSYDRIVESLPEALGEFGIHFDDENEFHADHVAKIAKYLSGKMDRLEDIQRQIGFLLAGAASRGHPRALRGIAGHIDGLGSFER